LEVDVDPRWDNDDLLNTASFDFADVVLGRSRRRRRERHLALRLKWGCKMSPARLLGSCVVAVMFLSCQSSNGNEDTASAWFTFSRAEDGSMIASIQKGEYEMIDEANHSTHRSNFDAATVSKLEELLSDDMLEHYRAHSAADGDEGCYGGAGYVLDLSGLTGCWVLDDVDDEQTRNMLDYLVQLYNQGRAAAAQH
jgi:hypothetical protein